MNPTYSYYNIVEGNWSVCNTGTDYALSFVVRISVSGAKFGAVPGGFYPSPEDINIPVLGVNQCSSFFVRFTPNSPTSNAKFTINVDINNDIPELNEGNNVASVTNIGFVSYTPTNGACAAAGYGQCQTVLYLPQWPYFGDCSIAGGKALCATITNP
jgi:hypothetical protein